MNKDEMSPKLIIGEDETTERLVSGVKKLTSAVSKTLGPSGSTVLFTTKVGNHVITKDGVTVAKQIVFKDPLENIGADMIKEASKIANKISGDGSTTTTILAQSIFLEGLKYKGKVPMSEIKKSLDNAIPQVIGLMEQNAIPIGRNEEKMRQIAYISSNGDENVTDLIVQAVKVAGENSSITIENTKIDTSFVEHTDGMLVDSPFMFREFITNKTLSTAELENAYVLVTEDKISDITDIAELLEELGTKPLVIVAEDYSEQVMQILMVNTLNKVINVLPLKAPGFGEDKKNQLEDIAVYTDTVVFSAHKGRYLTNAAIELLGRANKVISTADDTLFRTDTVVPLDYIKDLELQIDQEINEYYKNQYSKRLAKLSGGVATIFVGGKSEIEQLELRDRIEDALNAVQASIEEGIHKGGGVALLELSARLDNLPVTDKNKYGISIIAEAIKEPFRTIIQNTGHKYELIEEYILNGTEGGYDAKKGEYCNMFERGIIDPFKVTRVALEKAISISGTLLTISTSLIDDVD